jgi:hypothetical protein
VGMESVCKGDVATSRQLHREVLSDCALLTKVGREIVTLERLLDSTTPGHLWATHRPSMRNTASEKLARHLIHGLARDVASPAVKRRL